MYIVLYFSVGQFVSIFINLLLFLHIVHSDRNLLPVPESLYTYTFFSGTWSILYRQ